ncbi:MAG: prepilin-type N-terminal cleavage/methylation domain-containing protein [Candidatus Faecisoma sp.]|nr:prepilin-type N-terminal cleavage/methylation domain-containing protein [Candidatus Faecisoma sp.]
MKRKKGFTLIELLAVIIVLAIIALIATPIIFNVIENAKIKSLENSCYGVIDAVRTTYAEGLLNSTDGTVDLGGTTDNVLDLTVSGEKPIQGTWTIDNTKNSDERGIKIVGVKFASMKNYTCSNVDENDKITSKVTCEKDGVDEQEPTISAKEAAVTVNKGTDVKIKNYFNVKFGKTGGIVTCEVENVSSLDAGDHTVKCTATGTNGKTAEATVKITVSNTVSNTVSLKSAILGTNNSNVIATDQTWTTSWQTSDQSGLYAQTLGGNKTYYFRGNPTNNYIKFAGKDYRILRVNEDGTIRIMLTDSIGYNAFNSTYNTYDKMYYTNSKLKTVVDNWFTTNITGDNANKVVSGNYFCEAARVANNTSKFTAGSATVVAKESYTPTFNCTTDGNGKGVVTSKVGLVTYDETIYAGGWYDVSGLSYPYYLNSGSSYWTMSPAGFRNINYSALAWRVYSFGNADHFDADGTSGARPVLILSADTLVSGSGTSANPYVVK